LLELELELTIKFSILNFSVDLVGYTLKSTG